MNTNNMKNIIVLRDLPSNIVDEAIVILKANVNLKKHEVIEQKKENAKIGTKSKTDSKNYIVKEAELVINNYISSIERPKKLEITNKKLEQKYKKLKKINVLFAIVALFGIVINFV